MSPGDGFRLSVVEGPDVGRSVDVTGTIVVGRDPEAQIVLQDGQVSRRHFQVTVDAVGAIVQDLGSTNGTFVNGEWASEPRRLSASDRITAGGTVLEFLAPFDATAVRKIPLPPAAFPPAADQAPGSWNGIEVEGLEREFKGGFRAVNGVDLKVEPGQIFGFLGPNGAGKSTTVHMLTTLLPPTGGFARVAGFDVATQAAEVRGAIGVALQEASLDPLLNAWEHMNLQCALQGLPRSEWRSRSEELIERVRLTEAADRRAGGYSGGMKRRLDLALSLVHRPRIVFLDEPTTGLDPQSRSDLWDEVARLANEEGVTVFLTTQYLEEADVLADRIAIIDRGVIVAEGTPAQLKAEIGRPTAEVMPQDPSQRGALQELLNRFGEPAVSTQGAAVRLAQGAEGLPDVIRALDSAGLRIANLALHAPTLDDVFLARTGRSLEEITIRESGSMEIPPTPPEVTAREAARA